MDFDFSRLTPTRLAEDRAHKEAREQWDFLLSSLEQRHASSDSRATRPLTELNDLFCLVADAHTVQSNDTSLESIAKDPASLRSPEAPAAHQSRITYPPANVRRRQLRPKPPPHTPCLVHSRTHLRSCRISAPIY